MSVCTSCIVFIFAVSYAFLRTSPNVGTEKALFFPIIDGIQPKWKGFSKTFLQNRMLPRRFAKI